MTTIKIHEDKSQNAKNTFMKNHLKGHNPPMNRSFLNILIASIATLSGCGVIDKQASTEESFKEKASFSIGALPNEITISDVNSSGFSTVTFNAEANNVKYKCYYESLVAVKSDAICTKLNGNSDTKGASDQCNALLKAAGRCQ